MKHGERLAAESGRDRVLSCAPKTEHRTELRSRISAGPVTPPGARQDPHVVVIDERHASIAFDTSSL